MSLRKDKEREFYMQHMDTFKAIGVADPFFTIKTICWPAKWW